MYSTGASYEGDIGLEVLGARQGSLKSCDGLCICEIGSAASPALFGVCRDPCNRLYHSSIWEV